MAATIASHFRHHCVTYNVDGMEQQLLYGSEANAKNKFTIRYIIHVIANLMTGGKSLISWQEEPNEL